LLMGVLTFSDSISADEYRRLKRKIKIRFFIAIPVIIPIIVYLYGSLIEGEWVALSYLLDLIGVILLTVSLMWLLMGRDKLIKREKRIECKKENKTKKHIVIEYCVIILLFILCIAYAI